MKKFKKINLNINLKEVLNFMPDIDFNINLNINFFIVLVLFIVFLLMMALNSYTPLIIDDMVRLFTKDMIRIEGISDIIANEKYKYASVNPYQVGNFIAGILLILSDSIADFVNSIGFCVLIYMISSYGFISKKKSSSVQLLNAGLVLLVFLLMWVSIPKFGNTFLMIPSIAKYVWVPILCLLVITNARKIVIASQADGQMVGICRMLFMIIFSFLAGWSQENLAIGIIFIFLYYIFRSFEGERKNMLVLILSMLSMLTGFVVMMSSPSRRGAGGQSHVMGDLYAGASKLSAFNNDFLNLVLLFMIAAIILLVVSRLINVEKNWESEIYLLSGIISFLFVSLLPIGDKNPVFMPAIFFIISGLISFTEIGENNLIFSSACLGFILLIYVVLFIPSLPGALTANKDYLSRYSAREIIIIDNRTNGHFENIEIPSIGAKNTYMAAYGSPDGSNDPKYWVNQYISKYYGVGSVLVR